MLVMDRTYTKDNITFIIVVTVVMVTIVTMATIISIMCSRRRARQLESDNLTATEYTLTTDFTDVWSVQGHYNPIAI